MSLDIGHCYTGEALQAAALLRGAAAQDGARFGEARRRQIGPRRREVARDQVHAEAEDVRVNFEVSKACEAELHHYCASVKPEGALGCLELHLGGSDFWRVVSAECP